MPSRRRPTIAAVAAALVVALAAPRAEARRADPDDWDVPEAEHRRRHEREEWKMIRALVKGWTWAAMPRIGPDDDCQDEPPATTTRRGRWSG